MSIKLFFLIRTKFFPSCNVILEGSGASFPAPLYIRWSHEINKENQNIIINYQSVGSGAGIQHILEGMTDFGGTDIPLNTTQKNQKKVFVFPMVCGMIVIAFNIPEIKGQQLYLSAEASAGIFLGKILWWDHPLLKKYNLNISLPHQRITVITRADGSATTAIFTHYLSRLSSDFKKEIGEGTSVNWLTGIAARENRGVVSLIRQVPWSIGYMEYEFAIKNKLDLAVIENYSGTFVVANKENALKTISRFKFDENFTTTISNPTGINDYPIISCSSLLFYFNYPNKLKKLAVEIFLKYAITRGQTIATEMGYTLLPKSFLQKSARQFFSIISKHKNLVK